MEPTAEDSLAAIFERIKFGRQVAAQSTPAFAASLLTVAETLTLPPTDIVGGGVCIIETEMTGVLGPSVGAPEEQPAMATTRTKTTKTENPV
jgi:hypothetical protein